MARGGMVILEIIIDMLNDSLLLHSRTQLFGIQNVSLWFHRVDIPISSCVCDLQHVPSIYGANNTVLD